MTLKFHCTNVSSTESVTLVTFSVGSDDSTISGLLTKTIQSPNDAAYQTGKDYDGTLQPIS